MSFLGVLFLSMKQRYLIVFCYWFSTFVEGASRIILPLYLAMIKISTINIAWIFFLFEFFGLVTNIYSGILINKYGYKRAFVGSLIIHTLASFTFLSIHQDIGSLYVLILCGVARSMRGIGKELIKTTASAYVKQDKGGRSKLIQLLLGGKDTTKGVGMLAGGFMLTGIGFYYSFLSLGFITAVSTIIALIWINDFREKKMVNGLKGFLKASKEMKYLSYARAFLYAGRDLWLVIPVPVFAVQAKIDPSVTASILAVGVMSFGLIQPLFNALLRIETANKNKWKRRPLLLWTPIILALITASLLWLPSSVENFIWVILAYNIFAAIATVPHNHFQIKFARKKRASIDIAYYKTISQIGKVLAVLGSGYLYDHFGLKGCLVTACLALVLSSCSGFLLRKPQKAKDKDQDQDQDQDKVKDKEQNQRLMNC